MLAGDGSGWAETSHPEVALLQLPGANLYLWAVDYRRTGRSWFGPFFPVPFIPLREKPGDVSPFIPLCLALEPLEPRLFFDPGRVSIVIEGGEAFRPIDLGEPAKMRIWEPTFFGERDWRGCGEAWASVGNPFPVPPIDHFLDRFRVGRENLIEVREPTCFFIWFEESGYAERGYQVLIDGLQQAGAAVTVPPVDLKRGALWKYASLP